MMKSRIWLGISFLTLTFGTIFMSNSPSIYSAGDLRKLTVDAGAPVGTFKSLTGICKLNNLNVDTLRQLGVTIIRTHDMEAVEIASQTANNPRVIFPNFNADTNNTASYNFTNADKVLKDLVSKGVLPYIRVSNNREGFVPSDFKKYGDIVRHVVMHYNQGWANGFKMGIKYLEVWNQPDQSWYWSGTPQQFYQLYGEIAKAVKATDPSVLVGAPAATTNGPDWRLQFMQYVKNNNLPLDFYSFHHYDDANNNPYNYYRYAADVRKDLDAAGLRDVEIHLTEWGYCHNSKASMGQLAAFASASLAYMQDAPLSLQTLEVLSVYNSQNVYLANSNGSLNETGYAYGANSSLQSTPTRLKVEGTDTIGFTTLAGSTADEIRVLITNYEIPAANRGPLTNGKGTTGYNIGSFDEKLGMYQIYNSAQRLTYYWLPRLDATYSDNSGYDLTVTNLPAWAADGFGVSRYRIDDTHTGSLIDSTKSSGSSVRVSAQLPAPAVELIVIRANSAGAPTFWGDVEQQPTPSVSPTLSPGLSPSPTTKPSPSPSAGNNNYALAYTANDWGSGATVSITIKNNSNKAIDGWTLKWSFSGNQKISNMWNASYNQSGTEVTVKNMDFNAAIPSGGSVSFGFNLSYSGANPKPTGFTLNGVVCKLTD